MYATPLYELRQQPHFSVSSIKTFLTCPRKHRYQYTERLHPDFKPAALAFGSAWHDTIDIWLTADIGQDELRTHLRDGLLNRLSADDILYDDEDENEGVLVDLGVKMLDAFVTKVPKPERTLGVEVPFSMTLTHPLTGEVLTVPLIGALDAVVSNGETTAVWELKTGKRRWDRNQTEFDLQPTAYAAAAEELGYGGAEMKLLVTLKWARPDVQVESLVRTARDHQELVETALSVHRAVESGVDHRARSWQCRACPFAGACGG